MKPGNGILHFLSCGILSKELEAIVPNAYPEARLVFLDSILHMDPPALGRSLRGALDAIGENPCVLVYGDCHAGMEEDLGPGRVRVDAVNCVEMVLGKEAYAAARSGGNFIFLPEWTPRWREVFTRRIGFTDPALASEFMRETRQGLCYLDTGVYPLPRDILNDISAFFSMDVEVRPVGLGPLGDCLAAAVGRLEGQGDAR